MFTKVMSGITNKNINDCFSTSPNKRRISLDNGNAAKKLKMQDTDSSELGMNIFSIAFNKKYFKMKLIIYRFRNG